MKTLQNGVKNSKPGNFILDRMKMKEYKTSLR